MVGWSFLRPRKCYCESWPPCQCTGMTPAGAGTLSSQPLLATFLSPDVLLGAFKFSWNTCDGTCLSGVQSLQHPRWKQLHSSPRICTIIGGEHHSRRTSASNDLNSLPDQYSGMGPSFGPAWLRLSRRWSVYLWSLILMHVCTTMHVSMVHISMVFVHDNLARDQGVV